MTRAHNGGLASLALALLVGLSAGLGGLACQIPNPDHCVNKSFDGDAWCAENVEGTAFCSPCESAEHGCVGERPTQSSCPEYTAPAGTDEAETGDAGTDGGTSDAGETSGDETG